jgi:hypothetical protein
MPNPFAALAAESSGEEEEVQEEANPSGSTKQTGEAASHHAAANDLSPRDQISLVPLHPSGPASTSRSATFDEAEAGFTQRDLATCVHVLKQVSREDNKWALFKSTEFRELRVALDPIAKELFKKYDMKSVSGRKRQREERKEAKTDLQLMDREYANRSLLRAKRLQKLEQLNAQGGPSDEAPPSAAAQLMLTDCLTDAPETLEGSGSMAHAEGLRVPDGVSILSASEAAAAEADMHSGRGRRVLSAAVNCYTCKRPFMELHFFYDQLCPDCAALNYFKREQMVDMRGKWCLVTGARVKIGYHCCLKLLRCGANVVATSRFPVDCAARCALSPLNLASHVARTPKQNPNLWSTDQQTGL